MQIRVSPDVLRDVANKQAVILDALNGEISKIRDLINGIQDAWRGTTGANATNELIQISEGTHYILDSAGGCVRKLIAVADAFDCVDDGEFGSLIPIHPCNGLISIPSSYSRVLDVSGTVIIDPDRVRDIAKHCMSISTSITESANAFSDNVKGLSDSWEGRSHVKYEEETLPTIQALQEIGPAMAEYASQIVSAANRYEEIDNSL